MSKKVIVVLGATGQQGRGLVDAILEDPAHEFTARCVTRQMGDKARDLQARGCEVVCADLDDKGSLVKAFQGAHGAFVVTNFWDHMNAERELQQACNAAEAAKTANLRHVVWSSLEDTRKFIPDNNENIPWLGKYRVPHFDAKGEANEYFKRCGVPFTIVDTTFYWDNLLGFTKLQKISDDQLVMTLPMGKKKLSGIAANDIGRCVYGVFKNPQQYLGRQIGIAGEHLTGEEMATVISRITGKKVTYTSPTCAVYARQGFPGADDMANMFHFYQDYSDQFMAHRDIDATKKLHPKLQSFETFVNNHKAEFDKL
jgi:uncharacterized protein YbjT (DUF2867 family)